MADIIAHAQCSNQCLIFLGLATQPVNILKYSSPLGVDGGLQLQSCSFRKGYFRYPSNGDFSRSNSAVAKPTIPTASKKSGGGQRGI